MANTQALQSWTRPHRRALWLPLLSSAAGLLVGWIAGLLPRPWGYLLLIAGILAVGTRVFRMYLQTRREVATYDAYLRSARAGLPE